MNKYSKKQWSNPFPDYVKVHSQTARILLLSISAFVVIGLLYAYVRFVVLDIRIDKYANYPDLVKIYPAALEIAQEENSSARLVMVGVYGFDEEYEERLDYISRFYFCSPTDDWTLMFDVERKFRLFKENIETGKMKQISRTKQDLISPNCQEQIIDEQVINIDQIVEILKSKIPENSLKILEEKPRLLWVSKDDDSHLIWEAIFKFNYADHALRIVYNATTGEARDFKEMVYPKNLQFGRP